MASSKEAARPGVWDHRPTLDNMSPAQIRVVLERLLNTMQIEQRRDFMATLPGLYRMVYPGWDGKG
jgi:hypothetical protein